MQKKKRGGYRVRKLNRNIANNYNLKIMQKALYQYKDLRGAVLEVTPSRSPNKSMILPSDVNEEMFAKLFNGTVATKINKASSNKALIVFVVTSVKDKHRNKR
jgi:hypothetical protein